MLELYDSCPYILHVKEMRLKPARVLSNARVKCLVWGEDALAFVHSIPTELFALHLVVADQDIQRADRVMMESLPYKPYLHLNFKEHTMFDPTQARMFPHSVRLKLKKRDDPDDPEIVFIHPQSQLYLDVDDNNRSVVHPPFPDTVRFPTRTAFLDSMVATYLDPPSGRANFLTRVLLNTWFSYFLLYTLRNQPLVLDDGVLQPELVEVLRCLRPENQPYFEDIARLRLSTTTREQEIYRKKILEKIGKYEEARRPLPLPSPDGFITFRSILSESRGTTRMTSTTNYTMANRANGLAFQKRWYSTSVFRGGGFAVASFIRRVR